MKIIKLNACAKISPPYMKEVVFCSCVYATIGAKHLCWCGRFFINFDVFKVVALTSCSQHRASRNEAHAGAISVSTCQFETCCYMS